MKKKDWLRLLEPLGDEEEFTPVPEAMPGIITITADAQGMPLTNISIRPPLSLPVAIMELQFATAVLIGQRMQAGMARQNPGIVRVAPGTKIPPLHMG